MTRSASPKLGNVPSLKNQERGGRDGRIQSRSRNINLMLRKSCGCGMKNGGRFHESPGTSRSMSQQRLGLMTSAPLGGRGPMLESGIVAAGNISTLKRSLKPARCWRRARTFPMLPNRRPFRDRQSIGRDGNSIRAGLPRKISFCAAEQQEVE